jgi:hypothetical protein
LIKVQIDLVERMALAHPRIKKLQILTLVQVILDDQALCRVKAAKDPAALRELLMLQQMFLVFLDQIKRKNQM